MGWKQELWPEWEIECDIGTGASGTVYKIRRQDIGGIYYAALKVISFPQNKQDLDLMHRKSMTDYQISEYYHHMAMEVAREFAMMERLKGNSNIVSYEDHKIVRHKNGLGWDVLIRMELLTSLPEYLETHVINEKEVCRLGIEICNALILCEKENIIHRDIKPGNIFVSSFGDYKLGDFSLAKHVGLNTQSVRPEGTYAYMAPEVYKGQGYDFTIDIYSLGLILYRLMNRGRGPFQPLPPVMLSAEISEEANRKRLHSETLPKPIDASAMMSSIILKACACDSCRRYRNASEMQKALIKCISSKTVLDAKRQISYYLKKAASVLQDSYEDFRRENDVVHDEKPGIINDVEPKLGIKQKEQENTIRSESWKEKTMSDFFTPAGDL